jgi:hypothetical protein
LFDVKALELDRDRGRKYSKRVCESEKSWESERHFIVGSEKEPVPSLLPLLLLIRAE